MKDVYIPKKTSHLPLEIAYITSKVDKETSAWIQTNTRFYYPLSFVDYINGYYPEYSNYNIFPVSNSDTYNYVLLSVASDNFTNQTIMHMILETILSKYNLDSFVKQYDAMLCYENTFHTYNTNEWIEFISTYQKGDFIGKQIDNTHNVNGLTFMEVCDMDLFTHLFNIQQEKFSHITQFTDINKIIVLLQMVYKMPVNGSFDVLHNVCKTNIYYVFEGLGTSMYDWDYASATDEHIQDIINKMNAYYKN